MLKVKILIVDDEDDYCMIMSSYFTEKHYEVYTASTLAAAFSLLKSENPDILFLDNNLPDGQAWSHLDDITTKYPNLQIHLISAYHQKPSNLKEMRNVRLWEKPISMQTLDEVF